MAKIKWYSQTEWVDIQTGEIISLKRRIEYKSIDTETKSEIKQYSNGDEYGIKKHITRCIEKKEYPKFDDERNGRLRLF